MSNGWTLLREHKTPKQAATCAGAFTLHQVRPGEWATHWRNDDLGGYVWGHYFRTLAVAEVDFDARVAEWVRTYGRTVA